jgi:hypothetical protein
MMDLMITVRRLLSLLLCAHAFMMSGQIPKELRLESLRSREGFQWRSEHSSHFDYFYEPSSPAERDIDKIKAGMERDYAHLLALLGADQSDFRMQSFIVDSRLRMRQLCYRESNGWAIGTVFAAVYGDSIDALGPHEKCHLLAQHLWGPTHDVWLNEGLAVYSDDNWQGHPLHAICKQLHAQGKLIPLSSLIKNNWHHKHYPDMVTYPEAGSFVKFLYERYGVSSIKTMWQKGHIRVPETFGKSLPQLEQEWNSTIDASDAESFVYTVS